jgi:hypothetical protein
VSALRARFGVADPSLLGEPFMLDPTNRAVDPREKHRHGLEALAIGSQTGGNVPSGLGASHHDGSHWPLLAFLVAATRLRRACEDRLTQPRQQREIPANHRKHLLDAWVSFHQKNVRRFGTARMHLTSVKADAAVPV